MWTHQHTNTKEWKNEKFSLTAWCTENENSSNRLFSKNVIFTRFLPVVKKTQCVEKREILSHWKLFSWNQLFSNFFSKDVTFTKFLPKKLEREFPQFPHSVVWKCLKFTPTSKIFREINLQYKSLVKKLLWRNFCKKSRGKIYKFPHCVPLFPPHRGTEILSHIFLSQISWNQLLYYLEYIQFNSDIFENSIPQHRWLFEL